MSVVIEIGAPRTIPQTSASIQEPLLEEASAKKTQGRARSFFSKIGTELCVSGVATLLFGSVSISCGVLSLRYAAQLNTPGLSFDEQNDLIQNESSTFAATVVCGVFGGACLCYSGFAGFLRYRELSLEGG